VRELIAGIDFLEFRPSEIAAAVAISITEETQAAENSAQAFSNLSHHVQQVKLWLQLTQKKKQKRVHLMFE